MHDQKHRVLPLFEFEQISIADSGVMAVHFWFRYFIHHVESAKGRVFVFSDVVGDELDIHFGGGVSVGGDPVGYGVF